MVESNIETKQTLLFSELVRIIHDLGKKTERVEIQNKVLDSAKDACRIDEKSAQKLVEEIKSLDIPMLTEESIIQVVNFMPKDLAELKTMFIGAKVNMTPENFKRIHELVEKYRKK